MAMTYNELYLETRRSLKAAGIEACALEARLLLCRALGCTREELLSRLNMYCGGALPETVRAMAARRAAGEPAAYITESWEFYGLPMQVSPAVLIPRMDTEVLVRTAVDMLRGVKMNARVLDLGCGSGCIACAIARQLPAVRLMLVDISADALAIAKKNIARLRLSSRAVCIEADMLAPPPLRLGNFDLIVSNPPYIASAELETLDPSVRDWEPALALDGGEDGLDFYRSILRHWLSVLSDGGSVIFEVGEGQAEQLLPMMAEAGLKRTGFVRDTAGTARVVYGSK